MNPAFGFLGLLSVASIAVQPEPPQQLVVSQGDAAAVHPGPTEFQSPMVVEAPFPLADPSRWRRITSLEGFAQGKPLDIRVWPAKLGKEVSIPEWYALGRFSCDGVYLREEVKAHGTKWEEPGLRIQELRRVPSGYEVVLEATIYNPKLNHDKLVTLSYDILTEDGEVLTTASRRQQSSDNGKSGNNADVILLLSPEQMGRVAKLRLTMTTKDY